jgi:type IV pilus assembly protein PilE
MRKRGFTLVEIMIVVAIIALLAAIAIPSLLRAANESSAQAALKTIATAEITYRSANNSYGDLGDLGTATPPYIDAVLGCGSEPCQKSGYNFATTNNAAETFCVTAVPSTANVTGVRSFCITEDGVVRVGAADDTDHDACQNLGATQP